jgi:hypothetical protein
MNLIMCCQVIEGCDFAKDIQFSVVAAEFWKKIYPEGQAYVATNGLELIPTKYARDLNVIAYNFDKRFPALSRTHFMLNYIKSDMFRPDTVFAGHDVLFLKRLPEFKAKAISNYRYHPSQPYCSDLFIARDKDYSAEIIQEVLRIQMGMPKPIVSGPGDQLAYALTLGMPEKSAFNGKEFFAPRRPDVLVVPADQYLFTPNDFFPPNHEDYGKLTPNLNNEEMMATKTAIHFKGERKEDFFKFGWWAHEKGYLDLSVLEPRNHST